MYYIYLNIFAILFSYIGYLVPVFGGLRLILVAIFMLGVINLCERITKKFADISLKREIFSSKKRFLGYITASTAAAVLLEGVCVWIGKLWVYDAWPLWFYVLVFIPGFAVYWLFIGETYLAAKVMFDKLHSGKKEVLVSVGIKYLLIIRPVFILGFILCLTSIFYYILTIDSTHFNQNLISDNAGLQHVSFGSIIFFTIGILLISEYILYKQQQLSLFKGLFSNYFGALFGLILAAWVTGLAMETQNVSTYAWIYTNWPLAKTTVFGVPFLVLVTWPLHYWLLINVLQIITKKDFDFFWKGDSLS